MNTIKPYKRYGTAMTLVLTVISLFTIQVNHTQAAETVERKLVRRGEWIKTLLTNAGYTPTDAELTADSVFTDVEKDTWYVAYGNKAAHLGLVALDKDHTTLKPKETISRAEALKMALHIAGIPTPAYITENQVKFTDVTTEDWFAPYAVKAIELKIFDDDKFFRPEKKLTQTEADDLLEAINNYTGKNAAEVTITIENSTNTLDDMPHGDIFSDVWDKIVEQFYAPGGTDMTTEDLSYGAIQGMVEALDDPHSIFETPTEATSVVQTLNGEFVGIGVYISDIGGEITIAGFTEGSPAEKAGLMVNDVIVRVDSVDVTENTLNETAARITGAEGTDVTIGVQRNDETYSYTITRAVIEVTYTQDKLLPNGIWYIKFTLFSENTATEIADAIADLQAQDSTPQGLILDLRYNPGGYLDAAQILLSHFMEEGETLFRIANSVNNLNFGSIGPNDLSGIPVVVLMNDSSASAAEVTAAVLQEAGIAKVVGTPSYGKSTTQALYTYPDGSLLKLTIAEWLTPGGASVNGVGVTPDIVVERTAEDLESGYDPQLERAKAEILEK